jgi:hypothetical protein
MSAMGKFSYALGLMHAKFDTEIDHERTYTLGMKYTDVGRVVIFKVVSDKFNICRTCA